MITKEQKQEIIYDLMAKNLPLDLLVEVKDHMEEQLEYKIDFENKSFETAYEEVKKSWEKDLKLVYAIKLPIKKITVFQKIIVNKIYNKISKKSFLYFMPFLFLSTILNLLNKNWGKTFHLITYCALSIFTIITIIKYYKYYKSSTNREERKISIYQRGTLAFFISGVYILIFNLLYFENRYDKFYTTLIFLINGSYKEVSYFTILNTYIFILCWILGLQYFLKYKETVNDLKQKINLKL